jgi:hypothetical protein
VSVSGTGTLPSLEAFLGSVALHPSGTLLPLPFTAQLLRTRVCLRTHLTAWTDSSIRLRLCPPASPLRSNRLRVVQEYLPVVLRLRLSASPEVPTNPERTNLPQEPLGFRRTRFSLVFSLLIPAFSLVLRPASFSRHLLTLPQRSPTDAFLHPIASVTRLAPLHFRRIATRPVSYYALFQWWLLLSQHPGCLRNDTSFPTQRVLRDLSGWSGLFPSRRWILAPTVSLPTIRQWHSEFNGTW